MINAYYRKKDELTQRCQAAIILRRNQLLNYFQNFPVENAPTKFSCVANSDLQETLSDAQQFGDKLKEPLKHAWQKCKIIEIYKQKGSILIIAIPIPILKSVNIAFSSSNSRQKYN